MRITIESTDQITMVNGLPVRVWRGVTEGGIPCTLFIHRLAVQGNEDSAEFDAELRQTLPPPEDCQQRQLREVLP